MNPALSFFPAASAASLALALSIFGPEASRAPSLMECEGSGGLRNCTIAPEEASYASASEEQSEDGETLELHIINGPLKSHKFKATHDKDTSVYTTDDEEVPPYWVHIKEGDLKSLFTPVET